MNFFTGKKRTKLNATQARNVYKAVRPEVAFTRAILSASNVQAMTSLATPADRTMRPTVVSSSLSSVRMRQRTGKAVMEYVTPTKSIKYGKWTEDPMKWL